MKHAPRFCLPLCLLLLLTALALLPALSGCGADTGTASAAEAASVQGGDTAAGMPRDAGSASGDRVIHLGFTTVWGGLNPYFTTAGTMYELSLYDKLYDRLVFTDMAGAEILPRAAADWESRDGGRTAVFHLDPDARWADGEAVTARDWVFTVALLADPDCAFSTRVFTGTLAGTDADGAALPGETLGAEAPDDATLVFHFKEPMSVEDFLLHYNRRFFVLPAHLLEGVAPSEILDAPYWQHPIGSGPCVYASQVLGAEMELTRNPCYPRGEANWDRLVLQAVDSSSRLTALMSGEIDQSVPAFCPSGSGTISPPL